MKRPPLSHKVDKDNSGKRIDLLRGPGSKKGLFAVTVAVSVTLLSLSLVLPLLSLPHVSVELAPAIALSSPIPLNRVPHSVDEVVQLARYHLNNAIGSVVSVLPPPTPEETVRKVAASALALAQLKLASANESITQDLVYTIVGISELGGKLDETQNNLVSTHVAALLQTPPDNAKLIYYALTEAKTLHLLDTVNKTVWHTALLDLYVPEEGGFKSQKAAILPTMQDTYYCVNSMRTLGTWEEFTKNDVNATEHMALFVLSMNFPFGGFGDIPPPDSEEVDEVTLTSTIQAASLLEVLPRSENASLAISNILNFLRYSQAADGGFHEEPLAHLDQAAPSPTTTTIRALNLLYTLQGNGFSVPHKMIKRATAYIPSCVPRGEYVIDTAPWGHPDLEASYAFLQLSVKHPQTFGLPPFIPQTLFAVGLLFATVAVVLWFRTQVDHDSFREFVNRGKTLFWLLLLCYVVVVLHSQYSLTLYVALGTYLSMVVYNAQADMVDAELLVAVASVNCLGFVVLPLLFQMAVPAVFFQSIIHYVLALWAVLMTSVVTFASGYFLPSIKKTNMRFFTRASLIAWVVNSVSSAFLVFSSDSLSVYRLTVMQGNSLMAFVVLPLISYATSQGVATFARYMYITQGKKAKAATKKHN